MDHVPDCCLDAPSRLVGLAIVSQFWTPFSRIAIRILQRINLLLEAGIAGSDALGRDIFSQLMVGAWNSLSIVVVAVAGRRMALWRLRRFSGPYAFVRGGHALCALREAARRGSAIRLPPRKILRPFKFSLPCFARASVGDRDAAFPSPHAHGGEFHHGGPGLDARERQAKRPTACDITIPASPVGAIKVTTRDFR
jgi:hypothetical protein